MNLAKLTIVFAGVCLAAAPAQAYIGPGGGLSAVGALVALVVGVLAAFFGFLWYPVKRLRRKLRRERTDTPATMETPERSP